MIGDRAVVVSYSGCEMRILDGCRVDGSYKFKRTSLAKDVIEIASEDDLYAKVPLGAASLEGELAASGRLAIRTTIAGQMKLDGGIPELPEGGGCKGATHVIAKTARASRHHRSRRRSRGHAKMTTPTPSRRRPVGHARLSPPGRG
jgi:hypothetical protein